MNTSIVLPAILCLLLSTAQLRAATYYVATTGSDAGPGTAEQPFLTVQKGVNTAQPGDIVRVGSGTYSQDVKTARSGTRNASITLDGQNIATLRSIYMGHENINLVNFKIAGRTNRFSSLLFMERRAHHCVISNNILDGEFTQSIYMLRWNTPTNLPFGDEAASDTLVVSNTFQHGIGSAIVSVFGDRNFIVGNRLIDSDAVDWFRLWGRSNYIVGNLCSNLFVSGTVGNHPDFFQTYGDNGHGSRWNVVESNTVYASEGEAQLCMITADLVSEIRDLTFRNNLFVGVSAKGSITAPHVNWFNNLFVKCSTNPATAGHVLYFATLAKGDHAHSCKVYNNVFLDCGGGYQNRGWYSFDTSLTNVAADFNYVGKNGYQSVAVDAQRRVVGGPLGWDNFAWWEPHGINGGDPLFVDERQLDFQLKEGSPLIGTGLPLNSLFTTDIRGTIRGPDWDIGAFEAGARSGPPRGVRVVLP